jgi:hypothetical protein
VAARQSVRFLGQARNALVTGRYADPDNELSYTGNFFNIC